jgi:VCBS repeat-containing protein
MIWHDLCSNIESSDTTPLGCVIAGEAGGYLGNGVLEEGELGISTVEVTLGEGVCPSVGLASTITGTDGSFSFVGLTPGVYCVSAFDSNLQPGVWTYPEKAGMGSMTVALGAGRIEKVNFGWDYLLLPSTATPEPEDTPVPTPSCTDRAAFIKDVTFPDGTYIAPEEAFEKVWRIENTGTCPWTTDYHLVFISGYSMGGSAAVPLLGDIPSGSVVDLSIDLKAPSVNGLYKGYWMLRNPKNVLFGVGDNANTPLWVQVNVGPKPTPKITDWRGEYFDNRTLTGDPVLVRNDKVIDFNWRFGSPDDDVPVDNFSVRWTREIEFESAIYTFRVRMNDGARLWVDDQLAIDGWEDGPNRVLTVDLAMSEGEHDLRLEFYEHSGEARTSLRWAKLEDPTYAEWKGEYWFTVDLDSDWALIRNDQEINFNWGDGSPAVGIPSDDFSVSWSRNLEFESGKYRFYVRSDDGIRVYLDSNRIVDEWHLSGGTEVYTADRTLAGSHSLRVEYYEHEGNAMVEFWWEKVGSLNDPPAAVDDAYSVNEDGTLQVTAPGVLGNDFDAEGDPLTVVLESGVNSGTLTLNADGSFIYEPYQNFNGIDSFTYKANDGSSDSNVATVTITVDSMDDEPIAVADNVTTDEDTPVGIDVLGNDKNLVDTPISLAVEIPPQHGTAEIIEGPIPPDLTNTVLGAYVRYTPATNFNGQDIFSYTVTDVDGDSSTATVWVTINPVNDPPTAMDNEYDVEEDDVLFVGAPGVLGNDEDVDGDPLIALLEAGVSKGTLVLNEDGSFTYTPDPDFNGSDNFTYRVSDGSEVSGVATVTIAVSSVDDNPVAGDDNVTLESDEPVEIDVLANDTGLGDGPVVVTIETLPEHGEVEVVENRIRYTPSTSFEDTDAFTYTVTDADGDFSTATVTVVLEVVE